MTRIYSISDNAALDEDEPSILFTGCFHAEEVMGAEICMEAIRRLLTSYGVERDMTGRVDQYQLWFIPLVNPDGPGIVERGLDPEWRKDLRDNNGNGIWDDCDGVDLNRNFDFYWGGGDTDPCGYYYIPILGYLRDGKARNWQYAITGCLTYTVEVLHYEAQPSCDRIPAIVSNNLKGLFWLVDHLAGPGLTGLVTESSASGYPLEAEVRVLENYDPDYPEPMSPRMADAEYGRYWRPLIPKRDHYTVWFIKEGYDTVKVGNVSVTPGSG